MSRLRGILMRIIWSNNRGRGLARDRPSRFGILHFIVGIGPVPVRGWERQKRAGDRQDLANLPYSPDGSSGVPAPEEARTGALALQRRGRGLFVIRRSQTTDEHSCTTETGPAKKRAGDIKDLRTFSGCCDCGSIDIKVFQTFSPFPADSIDIKVFQTFSPRS